MELTWIVEISVLHDSTRSTQSTITNTQCCTAWHSRTYASSRQIL